MVGHTADQRVAGAPAVKLTLPAAVPETVSGNLIDGQQLGGGGLPVQAGLLGAFGDVFPATATA